MIGLVTLFIRLDTWPESVAIEEALKHRPGLVCKALATKLQVAAQKASLAYTKIVASITATKVLLKLQDTFRNTLETYYFRFDLRLLLVLKTYYQADLTIVKYIFYKHRGFLAVIALYVKAKKGQDLKKVKSLPLAKKIKLAKYIKS